MTTDEDLKTKLEQVQKGWLIDRIEILIERFNQILRIDQRVALQSLTKTQLGELGNQIIKANEWSVARDAIAESIGQT